jgi:hypothetical protein
MISSQPKGSAGFLSVTRPPYRSLQSARHDKFQHRNRSHDCRLGSGRYITAQQSRNQTNSLSSIRWRRGPGRGGAFLPKSLVQNGLPLSSVLSPLLRRGERRSEVRSVKFARPSQIV